MHSDSVDIKSVTCVGGQYFIFFISHQVWLDTVYSSIKWKRSLFHICVHQQSNLQQHYHSWFRNKISVKMLFICALNASKVIFVTFHSNCRLHAVSVGKPSEQMSNFWTVPIFINRILKWFSVFCTVHTNNVKCTTTSQPKYNIVHALLLICVSWAITGHPQNSVFIDRL